MYMPYDFQNEVLQAMAETLVGNDKVTPAMQKKISLFLEGKRVNDQMEQIMEQMRSGDPADTAKAAADDAEDVVDGGADEKSEDS